MKKDVYDLEVERLSNRPELLWDAWSWGYGHSVLFDACARNRVSADTEDHCGCLTQVKCGSVVENKNGGVSKHLTNEIRKDKNIPADPYKITKRHLRHFAKWQRRLDRYYGRKAPNATA